MKEIIIDVSSFAPPEPMQQILIALSQLSGGQYLKVIHRRQPFPLFEQLLKSGWGYQCNECSSGLFHIYIFKESDKALVLICI